MSVAREIAQQLAIPVTMILVGVLVWAGLLGETTVIAVLAVLIIITAFRAGRISTEIWPR